MNYGIPYMGSKSKIAPSIAMNFPKADHIYDLFGGGFSMTHYMMMHCQHKFKHFHYNEIKSDIVQLVRDAIAGKYNYDVFKPEWISREDFANKLDDPYVCICWSFGNNQGAYLFNPETENKKKSIHQAVVFDQFDSFASKLFGLNKWPSNVKTITQKRLYYGQRLKWLIAQGKADKQLLQLQQLERLQQLQQLERVPGGACMTSLDYREVNIEPNSVVYCDIPYAGTADYGGGFSHQEFFDWAASRDFPVYISEYDVPDKRFKLVYTTDKRSMLSQDKYVGNKEEKLYWNGKTVCK